MPPLCSSDFTSRYILNRDAYVGSRGSVYKLFHFSTAFSSQKLEITVIVKWVNKLWLSHKMESYTAVMINEHGLISQIEQGKKPDTKEHIV